MVPQGHRLWKVKIRISLTRLLFFTAKLSETKIVMNPLLFSKGLGIGMQHGHNSYSLRWRHNGRDSVSNHQPHHCLLNRYSDADQRKHQSSASLAFVWNSPGIGEFPAQMASCAENVSIWWRHHVLAFRNARGQYFGNVLGGATQP